MMKIYNRVVIDIVTGEVLAEDVVEYDGALAMAGGGGSSGQKSQPSYILPGLLPGIQDAATRSIINPAMGNETTIPYTTSVGGRGAYTVPMTLTDINMNRAINQVRGGYAARGLANSGIAIGGEQNAIGQLALQGQQQQAQNLTNLLSAGTGQTSQTKQSSGVSVVCSELNRQGLLDDITWQADCEYAKRIPESAIRGYHRVAKPLVSAMQRSKLATRIALLIAGGWAMEMRKRVRGDCDGSVVGRMLLRFGVPFMSLIGRLEGINHGR